MVVRMCGQQTAAAEHVESVLRRQCTAYLRRQHHNLVAATSTSDSWGTCNCRRVVAQAALDARNTRFRQRDPALRSMAEDADPAARDTGSAPSSEMEVGF